MRDAGLCKSLCNGQIGSGSPGCTKYRACAQKQSNDQELESPQALPPPWLHTSTLAAIEADATPDLAEVARDRPRSPEVARDRAMCPGDRPIAREVDR